MWFSKWLLLVLMVLCIGSVAMAQSSPQAGVVLRNDSALKLVFRFRMQNRCIWLQTMQQGSPTDALDFVVRRFRLKLEGYALTPRLEYKLQLGLSEHDMAIGDGVSPQSPVLDALVYYNLAPHTRIGMGQGKLPGGRQAIISSGELELPERPLANSAFNIDRDRGVFVQQRFPLGNHPMLVQGAVSQGEGRGPAAKNAGLCYTGRVEWYPWGEFHANGAYTEGDLYREPKPRLAVAVAYSSDHDATRTQAQLGSLFPAGRSMTINTFFADAIIKYSGWAWQADFSRRLAEGTPSIEDPTTHLQVTAGQGWGLTNQASRMVGRAQVIIRHSMIRMDGTTDHSEQDEAMMGCSYYLNGHRVKLQSALLYHWTEGNIAPNHSGNAYGAMVQVEIGI